MLLTIISSFRVQQDVVHPSALLSSTKQVVTVEVPGGVHSKAWISSPKIRVVVGYGVAVPVDDERVPLPVNAFLGVVVSDGLLQAQGVIEVDGLLTKAWV